MVHQGHRDDRTDRSLGTIEDPMGSTEAGRPAGAELSSVRVNRTVDHQRQQAEIASLLPAPSTEDEDEHYFRCGNYVRYMRLLFHTDGRLSRSECGMCDLIWQDLAVRTGHD